jgi:hypothetical protein
MSFQVKQVIKYARKASIHVSPTVLWNGVEEGQISSGWTADQWMQWVEKKLESKH